MRHAEKPADKTDPHLSTVGATHALRLAATVPALYGIPDVVFAAADVPDSDRCTETARPLVEKYGLRFEHAIAPGDVDGIVAAIKDFSGDLVLVIWEHNRLPLVARRLGWAEAPDWPDDDFSTVWEIGLTLKFAKADDDPDKIAQQILDGIPFTGWEVLTGVVTPVLDAVMAASGQEALAQLSITDKSIVNQVNERALAFAQERSAEMVGMKWIEGELVENPDAEWSILESTRDMLRSQIVNAIENGDSAATLSDDIESSYAFSDQRATMIARTELIGAHAQGNLAGWQESGVVKTKTWLLGSEHDRDDECLAGETLVLPVGRISRTFKRSYTGPFIELKLSNGAVLTATPNHPVLTNKGWKPAGLLDTSDHLIDARPWLKRAMFKAEDFDQREARIDDVVAAFGGTATAVNATARDFHGDGAGSEVYVVTTESLLLRPASRNAGSQSVFRWRYGKLFAFSGLGTLCQCACRSLHTARSIMSVLRTSLPLFGTRILIPHAVAFAGGPDWDSRSFQSHNDGNAADADECRDLFGRESLVEPSEVVCAASATVGVLSAKQYCATRDVYNLTTEHGIYIADGIIVRNCDDNADEGPIGIDEDFPDGSSAPPAHPSCVCSLIAGLDEDAADAADEGDTGD